MVIFEKEKPVKLACDQKTIMIPTKLEFINVPALTGILSVIYLN